MPRKGVGSGVDHPNWRGGLKLSTAGYVMVQQPGHPRASKGYVPEHILMVERVLGRAISLPIVVHHVNEQKADNRPDNFAVLPNQGYHRQLHARLRVLRAGGNPWTQRMCCFCRLPKNFDAFSRAAATACRECAKAYEHNHYGRQPLSERHPGSKLTPEQVKEIRVAAAAGEKQAAIGRRFGVSKFVINDIVHRRKWKGVA